MPATAPHDTQPEPTTTMRDADLVRGLEAFDQAIAAEGRIFNSPYAWHVMLDSRHKDIVGDELIRLTAIASLTRNPAFGCRATHKAVAIRATNLKKLFALAEQVGWPRIMSVLNVTE